MSVVALGDPARLYTTIVGEVELPDWARREPRATVEGLCPIFTLTKEDIEAKRVRA